ncbi:MAG: hypothetical protein ABEK01_05900 [Candidatus Nanohaloarchaea archaeon]
MKFPKDVRTGAVAGLGTALVEAAYSVVLKVLASTTGFEVLAPLPEMSLGMVARYSFAALGLSAPVWVVLGALAGFVYHRAGDRLPGEDRLERSAATAGGMWLFFVAVVLALGLETVYIGTFLLSSAAYGVLFWRLKERFSTDE